MSCEGEREPSGFIGPWWSSPWWWRQYAPLKCLSTQTRLHGAITQMALIFLLAAVRTWNLESQVILLEEIMIFLDYCIWYLISLLQDTGHAELSTSRPWSHVNQLQRPLRSTEIPGGEATRTVCPEPEHSDGKRAVHRFAHLPPSSHANSLADKLIK
jgi:hypothetical protein